MAAITREILVDAPVELFWGVVADYARYPEFVPGVRGCRVLASEGDQREVEYEVDLAVRRIAYVLAHVETPPRRNVWTLVHGELLTRSDGSWDLEGVGGRTRARYTVDVALERPALVPRAVVDRVVDELTRVQLPRTLEAFKGRAESLARR